MDMLEIAQTNKRQNDVTGETVTSVFINVVVMFINVVMSITVVMFITVIVFYCCYV